MIVLRTSGKGKCSCSRVSTRPATGRSAAQQEQAGRLRLHEVRCRGSAASLLLQRRRGAFKEREDAACRAGEFPGHLAFIVVVRDRQRLANHAHNRSMLVQDWPTTGALRVVGGNRDPFLLVFHDCRFCYTEAKGTCGYLVMWMTPDR